MRRNILKRKNLAKLSRRQESSNIYSSNYQKELDMKHKNDLKEFYDLHKLRLMSYYSPGYSDNTEFHKKETELKAAWSTFCEILKLQRSIFNLDTIDDKEYKNPLDELINSMKGNNK